MVRSRRWAGSSIVLSNGCGWEIVFLRMPLGALEDEAMEAGAR